MRSDQNSLVPKLLRIGLALTWDPTDFFMRYKNLKNEVLKTTGLQTSKLLNNNDNPGSKNQ